MTGMRPLFSGVAAGVMDEGAAQASPLVAATLVDMIGVVNDIFTATIVEPLMPGPAARAEGMRGVFLVFSDCTIEEYFLARSTSRVLPESFANLSEMELMPWPGGSAVEGRVTVDAASVLSDAVSALF